MSRTDVKVVVEYTDENGNVKHETYRLLSGTIELNPRVVRASFDGYHEVYDTDQYLISLEGIFEKVPVMYIPPPADDSLLGDLYTGKPLGGIEQYQDEDR